jgi:hypothetical protein
MRFNLLVSLAFLLLMGCGGGSVTRNQCYAGDWQTLGYRDGSQGYSSTRLLDHQDACVSHGVVPDRAAYMAGHREGLAEYCRPSNAFAVGERGYPHNNVCPDSDRNAFESAYRSGRQFYLARVEVEELERLIAQRQFRLEQVKAELVSSATEQLNPTLTPAQRVDLLAWMQRLGEEKATIERELPALEARLVEKSERLSALEISMASAR